MSKSLMSDTSNEEAEAKAAVEKLFVEIEREYEQINRDREEFERSRARTRAMLDALIAA